MFVLAEGMIFTSAEGFFLHRRRVFEKITFFAYMAQCKISRKKLYFPKVGAGIGPVGVGAFSAPMWQYAGG